MGHLAEGLEANFNIAQEDSSEIRAIKLKRFLK